MTRKHFNYSTFHAVNYLYIYVPFSAYIKGGNYSGIPTSREFTECSCDSV